MSDAILKVEQLVVDFPMRQGVSRVLNGVSFELERGKTTCIVGESGSGKSMTARSILNMVPRPGYIASGNIRFQPDLNEKAVDLAAMNPRSGAIRSIRGGQIGMIFQEPMSSLSPVHTIGAQIIEAVRLHRSVRKKEARSIAIDMLRQVEIPEPEKAIDRYAFEFSGGMRQRAMIAMALSCRPDVLIADEPTTALDVTTQAEILDLIAGLQAELGMAVMFITHDMGVVAEIAHDVVVMHEGCVIERGDVDAIFYNPCEEYTRRLLNAVKQLSVQAAIKSKINVGSTPILEVKNISMRFEQRTGFLQRVTNTTHAVNDVSFSLAEGETLGIVGESGSGKTTVGRCVARVYDPVVGEVIYRGKDLLAMDIAAMQPVRKEIRMIFQDPFASLNPRMTIRQIIAEPLIVNKIATGSELEGRVEKLLRQVELDPSMMERYPHAFSGGQRQRIVVARAIALEPRLIIADEPTSALDVSIRTQVLDLLLQLQAELNLSFLFISHDMAVIRYFSDRVAVMYQGRIVEIGSTEQIINNPQHAYTKALLSAVPETDPGLRGNRQRIRYRGGS